MEPLDFLAAVLPPSGKYCTFALVGERKVHKFTNSLEQLFANTKELSDAGHEAWMAMSTFGVPNNRTAANTIEIRSLFFDLDCGHDVKDGKPRAFPTKRVAVEELMRFERLTGLDKLGKPYLIDSGGGVHVHYAFSNPISTAQWKVTAEAFKKAAAKHGFNIDASVSSDAARVMRCPDTFNNKGEPRPVVIKQVGDVFEFSDLATLFQPYEVKVATPSTALTIAGSGPVSKTKSALAEALAGNALTRFKTIWIKTAAGDGCGQLAYYVEHASDDGMEPIWRGMLSWAKCCVDSTVAAVKLSSLHPYDTERMNTKLNEIKGPYSCAKMDSFNPNICPNCQYWGKFTNPLVLGRELQVAEEHEPVSVHDELPPINRPSLPRGFDYAKNGGIIYHKPAEKKAALGTDIQLTAYDLFLSRIFRSSTGEHIAEFTAVKENETTTFAIPTADTTAEAKVVSFLANNNIYTIYGAGHDTYLARYVRACIAERSGSNRGVVNIPPRFGWQDNGAFALGDMVYSPDGPAFDYNYTSNNLNNLIQGTKAKGTLEGWRAAFEMMRRKGAWGHLSVAMAGFGSVLMRFMPKGTNASVIHICQETSSGGKSFALNLQASIWGSPKQYFVVAKTSETTMMQRAGLLGGLPLVIDEVTPLQRKTNGEWGPEFMFDFANGAHKIKGSHAGNTEISHEILWDAVASLTSNAPMLEFMVGARKVSSHGEVRRFLEWFMPTNYELDLTEEDTAVYSNIFSNHGVAGKMFVKWCVTHQDEVQDICDKALALWKKHSGATGKERFWSSNIASTIAACSICAKLGIVDIPISHILDFWLGVVTRMRAIIDGSTVSAEDLLNRYIADNNASFIRVENNTILRHLSDLGNIRADSPRTAIRGRIEYNTTPGYVDIFIEEKLMKVFCAEANRSYVSFVSELETLNILKKTRRDLLAGTNGPELRVNCIHICREISPDDLAAKSGTT